MPDREIKRQSQSAGRFLRFPLLLGHFVPSWLCDPELIMQNKPNFKMGNINISTAKTKAYAKKQRAMNNERYSKQTQSNPISNAKTPSPACRTRDCRGPGGLVMTSLNRFFRSLCSVEMTNGG